MQQIHVDMVRFQPPQGIVDLPQNMIPGSPVSVGSLVVLFDPASHLGRDNRLVPPSLQRLSQSDLRLFVVCNGINIGAVNKIDAIFNRLRDDVHRILQRGSPPESAAESDL